MDDATAFGIACFVFGFSVAISGIMFVLTMLSVLLLAVEVVILI